jgi:glycoprotein endo-alpha-1,2-mannosidase
MTALRRRKHLLFVTLIACTTLLHGGTSPKAPCVSVPRRVMAFYYPWYGVPDGTGGSGRTMHWGHIDVDKKDISASTNYPMDGAYDSHDPDMIEKHCRWAVGSNIDTFIVSWWGHGSYSDRVMDKILDICERNGMKACIYYETVPRPRTPQSAADDIIKVLNRYGGHDAYLKAGGRPVVFVYGRALEELGLRGWLEAIEIINSQYEGGFAAIGDAFSYGSARVFDGVHTYNTAGSLRVVGLDEARKWASDTYRSWVQMANRAGKISTVTVIPGYDDTKIREPGLAVGRYDGELYHLQWEEAIEADPHWILITSFNEWHEGSEIEPSLQYGRCYLDLTAGYAKRFKAKPRSAAGLADSQLFSVEEKNRLREKFKGVRVGVLPNADSIAFWWLLDLGVDIKSLKWQDVVRRDLTVQNYPVLLYCGGENYHRSVDETGDVDDALAGYLKSGGCLLVLPSKPWPFYYNRDGHVVKGGERFGLNLRMGWERPPAGEKFYFIQPECYLPHVSDKFAFPVSGDLRWRPFFAGESVEHISLLQLRNKDNEYFGDAVAFGELEGGGRVLYVWFGLLDGPYAEALLYDLFDFVEARVDP